MSQAICAMPVRQLSSWKRYRNDGRLQAVLLFLPPALILFSIFVIWPIISAANFSVYKWSGYGELTEFVGLQNYRQLLDHSVFHQSVWNSVRIMLASIFVQIPLALGLAMLIHKKTPANTIFRLMFLLPYILAEIASGLIWSFIFDGDYGVSGQIAKALNIDTIYILADKSFAFYAILTVIVWKYFGFHMMIYIAALQGVPNEIIEASRIDGASPWQIAIYVKLPMIVHAIKLSVFFAIVGAMQVFDIIIPLTNGGPANSTHSMVSYLYTFGLARQNIGYGSAVGVVLFIACVVTAFTYKRFVMKEAR
ncbi:MAG: sugar ABC transporter permease [Formivibrio sp.]|nr:sugar ABC transporter permease [Formivibrio sp.]